MGQLQSLRALADGLIRVFLDTLLHRLLKRLTPKNYYFIENYVSKFDLLARSDGLNSSKLHVMILIS